MLRAQKEEKVALLQEVFQESQLVVLTHQTGLTVAETTELRGKMREAGAGFRVTKNRLARIALEGTAFAHIADRLTGPPAIAYSVDPVAAAKATVDYAKKNDKLVIVGGALGDKALDADGIQALAKLPSLDELRGKLIGVLQAPATKVAGVLQAPAGQLARVFSAYGSKEEGEAA